MCDCVKDYLQTDWDVEDKILCVTMGALIGIIIGMILAPRKKCVVERVKERDE